MCRNAVIASPDRSCRPPRSCGARPIPMIPISTRQWRGIFAAAAPMSGFVAPSSAPRQRCDPMTRRTAAQDFSRRQILVTGATLTGGLALGLIIPGAARAAVPELEARYWANDAPDPNEVNAWVVIEPDD